MRQIFAILTLLLFVVGCAPTEEPVKDDAPPGIIAEVGETCGGIAAIPCAEGLECEVTSSYPDAGGKCIEPQEESVEEEIKEQPEEHVEEEPEVVEESEEEGPRIVSKTELAQHDSSDDCWQVIFGNVFDVTWYIERGEEKSEVLQLYCGKIGDQLIKTEPILRERTDTLTHESYYVGKLEE